MQDEYVIEPMPCSKIRQIHLRNILNFEQKNPRLKNDASSMKPLSKNH